MRQFIDIISTGLLLESNKDEYFQMINPVLDAFTTIGRTDKRKDDPGADLGQMLRDKLTDQWTKQVKEARLGLKRRDRIVWYLNMVRAAMVELYGDKGDPAKINRLKQEYSSLKDKDFARASTIRGSQLTELTHFFSLPIPAIQNFQFTNQSYNDVIDEFKIAEKKWQDKVKNSIQDDDSTILIDFKDGWVWVNTNKAYCSKEAEAMGHCGNEPRANSTDNLLSLRKKIMVDGGVRWEAHITFILNEHGYLTEMKGRANSKPAARYHTMIKALLLNPIVKGIIGGGHKAENNFSLEDLPAKDRAEIIKKKPELGSIEDIYRSYGLNKLVEHKVDVYLRGHSLSVYDYDTADSKVILRAWDNLLEFARDTYFNVGDFEPMGEALEGYWNDYDWLDADDGLETSSAEYALKKLHEESDEATEDFFKKIAHKLGVADHDVLDGLLHVFPKALNSLYNKIKKDAIDRITVAARHNLAALEYDLWTAKLTYKDDGSLDLSMPIESFIEYLSVCMMHEEQQDNPKDDWEDDFSDDGGMSHPIRESNWMVDSEYRTDTEEPMTSMATVVNELRNEFYSEILSLFDTNDRML